MVAAMIFATAMGTTHIATRGLTRQIEQQLDHMGQIYLDGLSAALLPSAIQRDAGGIDRALDEALRMHHGLVDRRLVVLTPTGQTLARADRDGLPVVDLPDALRPQDRGEKLDSEDGSYWVWRPLTDERIPHWHAVGPLTVVANLDVSDYVAERKRLWWQVVAFNLALSSICALLGLLLMRRLQRPVNLLTRHIQLGGETGPVPVPEGSIPADDRETARLLHAYNRMARDAREREGLLVQMAEQEREAILGRMAATLAHEVRNPLAGVLTAIETLRKFGDQPHVRSEALDFMERGMRALADVADATLKTHRQPGQAQSFGPQDLHDVQRLIEAEARRAGVELVVEIQFPHAVPLSGGEVRQILLNLLLNALKASSTGGSVTLRCELHSAYLQFEVIDQGMGLPDDLARRLEQGAIAGDSPAGLGVAVVVRLVQRLRGRVAVDAHSGRGTRIVLQLPLNSEPETP